jgi:DNA-binding HxlR family transcriptional regulator
MLRKTAGNRRSDCPVNFAVESLGDRWSLIIVRDMIFWGKKTYGDFLKSDERIATNILADRLAFLEKEGIITKAPDPLDKRKEIYSVTERGIDLVPMLLEMIAWSAKNECWHALEPKGTIQQKRFVERVAKAKNKARIAEEIRETVQAGGYVFEGVARPENPGKKGRGRLTVN